MDICIQDGCCCYYPTWYHAWIVTSSMTSCPLGINDRSFLILRVMFWGNRWNWWHYKVCFYMTMAVKEHQLIYDSGDLAKPPPPPPAKWILVYKPQIYLSLFQFRMFEVLLGYRRICACLHTNIVLETWVGSYARVIRSDIKEFNDNDISTEAARPTFSSAPKCPFLQRKSFPFTSERCLFLFLLGVLSIFV